jgi:hypothetical protein
MSDEVGNLILEQLRGIRSDIAKVNENVQALTDRVDTMETELRGASYIMTVSIGSLLGELKELKARVAGLEKS